jgi:ABC-type polar amino acid transport system ATPase subunit
MEQTTILKIEHLNKKFEDNEVLKDINLTVHKKDVIAVIAITALQAQ